ncbi:50S ribosome-binding GTPase [Actinoplanes sp. LDG1-06]|uniref:50S ribosome-binding GTPase n=1 Tax=Paractinoplanes ovalisporus TaxID=2810368 RepID=A0ABS2AIL6_9ACTN|nr:GTPase [Actinoplanes ovalisporus]MBM2619689.1 50S ribosome-binding GTPase [Actinoplanes ovalisporus]
MTVVDINAVREWLGRLPGGSPAGAQSDDWEVFAKQDRPVVTLFGSYDTGKSSLLRRLLVDAGREVPGWLTISARHETFEVNDAEFDGCVLRDTPGFSVGGSDLRARTNTGRAMAAVGLTDVGVAVLTSQLATAERDLLQELVAQRWPAGTMWFVISRFDEAGVDPEYDLADYRELRDRKVSELRDLFGLDERARIFVVAPDPYQTAGSFTDLDRTTWDEFRGWDGMDDLAGALAAVSSSPDRPEWRAAAGQRYWARVLDETVTELRAQLADYTTQAQVAAQGVARRELWENELDALDKAARAGLDGLVDEVVRRTWDANADDLKTEIQRAFDDWFTRHEVRLQRLRQSVRKTKERERARPSWAGFAALVENLGSDQTTGQPEGSDISGHVETVGPMLIGVLRAATEVAGTPSGRKAAAKAAKTAGRLGKGIGVAEAVLPLAVHVAKFVDEKRSDQARRNEERAAVDARQQVVAECTQRAREAWQPFVDDVRDEIVAETADQVALDAQLRDLVGQLERAVAEGENLS